MIEPDGLLGAMIAAESLGIVHPLVNGAGGCRSRAQIMLHELIPYYVPEDPSMFGSRYFSRQSRLPCTYLNNGDIVFGTGPKVSDGVSVVGRDTSRDVVLLDTLGASLICTDYRGLFPAGDGAITIDGDLSSMRMCEGYDRTVAAILGSVLEPSGDDGSVNLLGYGIADPGWVAGASELRRLLEAMGLKVNAVLGCMPSESEIGALTRASLNVMVRPEYCRRTAEVLEGLSGASTLRPSEGAPVGYRATRSFIEEVARETGADPTPALDIVDSEERYVRSVLTNFDRMPRGLHARGVSFHGDSSTVYPLLKWMHGTFGMMPRRVTCSDDEYSAEIASYLDDAGCGDSEDWEEELVFADGMTCLRGNRAGTTIGYVEIGLPRGRQIDLMGRCVVGTVGCRYILDEMFNRIGRFRCGQPTELDYRPGYCGCGNGRSR